MLIKAPASQSADTLRLHYQPVIRLRDGALSHAEVLARGIAPDGALRGQQWLIEAMDKPDLALSMTRTIMEQALSEYQALNLSVFGVPVAFNLPLSVLVHPETWGLIEKLRAQYCLAACLLRFELTETQPVHDLHLTTARIQDLREAGYLLALDDVIPDTPFLDALMAGPISAVKLDRSVVIDEHPEAQVFIGQVSRNAALNGLDVVAEGIETNAQLQRMQGQGVTHGQGFLLSRPMTAPALAAHLAAR
ncbi:EAL domain-containing protein [Acidocella aminolytica]|jgi:EAL domain-containing protein (putative c-di-GMP-specific phosphodiesterase class I)|uniref:PAS/PAC sensor-containing diguanylate cyclase/signaling protein n=1 Tax=Acidocella aminolytica 101 = DSM 11237 TaxID=1120923 RepID=A0A0D6PJ51_9PROT|nr:EAL domain-containing protein [Acidocella aminolytica]GAN81770.1 PAS/PAC sensor-containing diguanylate cyclase/signaling protein [Acidocella aminolytica 101 = DSM 11237]GBQ37672.1 diguanylate cyclase [Acidocella aminolytica 101 = DSM 11237]SHE52396.1 EAL domain, c-di-GMP-specific phosphodiesterase class I (or its enzymatically inactive variant) [Acidocella aminolytica 101 = DSM 11237]